MISHCYVSSMADCKVEALLDIYINSLFASCFTCSIRNNKPLYLKRYRPSHHRRQHSERPSVNRGTCVRSSSKVENQKDGATSVVEGDDIFTQVTGDGFGDCPSSPASLGSHPGILTPIRNILSIYPRVYLSGSRCHVRFATSIESPERFSKS